jgi:hypothetical protein
MLARRQNNLLSPSNYTVFYLFKFLIFVAFVVFLVFSILSFHRCQTTASFNMPFSTLSLFGLAFAGLSFAQTTTVSLFVPGADIQPLIGAVVGSVFTSSHFAIVS